MEVNVHHAKTHLSKLIAAAEAGEEVIIARNGKPVVRLVLAVSPPLSETPPAKLPDRVFGRLKGKLNLPADWEAQFAIMDKDLEEIMTHAPLMHDPAPPRDGR